MRLLLFIALGLGLLPAAAADDTDGFVPLFDGKTLKGWTFTLRDLKDGTKADPKDVWSVTDGYIRCIGRPNGYIATDREFGSYVLRLKWRFPKDSKGGNSGVLLHVQTEDKVWPDSVEAQLASGRAGDFWLIMPPQTKLTVDPARLDPNNKEKRHFFRINKDEVIEKAFGEWNDYEITCTGGDITIIVNGRKVNEGKDGNLTKGRIALQSEGTEIHFKDIAIKSLK